MVKRPWFSWPSIAAGIPTMAVSVLLLLAWPPNPFAFFAFAPGVIISALVQWLWVPFVPWPKPIIVPPVIIPPADDDLA
jgi:hypothetical protein